MALYHFTVKQIKRSAGQSAIACAAYRSGEKLHSDYYDETNDYTRKGGVIYQEILLPLQAPKEYRDRETLWNAVEEVEKHPKAQLAYNFDIALQNEMTMDENIKLAREFVQENFVEDGMCVDLAVHNPEKEGGNPNPHFHVMTTMRPINPDGTWGQKQKREYILDEQGNNVLDKNGKPTFNAVPTTDWSKPETLERWRRNWADLVNKRFEEKGLECRIDHRSNLDRGIEELPTIHEGHTVRALEKKGIATEKGNINRWIRNTNQQIRKLTAKIKELLVWIGDLQKEPDVPEQQTVVDLLNAGLARTTINAKDIKRYKTKELKEYVSYWNYLQEHNLTYLEDLDARIETMRDRKDELKTTMDRYTSRRNALKEQLRMLETYRKFKPVYEEYYKKKLGKKKFSAEHKYELQQFQMAKRKLDEYKQSGEVISKKEWMKEMNEIEQKYSPTYESFKEIRSEVYLMHNMKNAIDRGRNELKSKTKTHEKEETR